jgi:hypothetical protein
MLSVGIGELQKNTSIFTNLQETIQIIDKRKKQVLAMVYPIREQSVINSIAGKYKNRIEKTELTMDEIKEQAMMMAMEDKYGLSS